MALDLGAARIGVAVSDGRRRVASPYEVLARTGDEASDNQAIARLVEEVGATTVVVGLPVQLDGRVGTAAAAALAVVDRLRADLGARLGVEVVTADERLSTVEAHRRRVEQLRARDAARRGGRGGRAGTPSRSAGRRPVVDHVAAAVFLQSWLDRSLPDPTLPDPTLPDPTWHDPT